MSSRPLARWIWSIRPAGLIARLLAVSCVFLAGTASAREPSVPVSLRPAVDRPGTRFEGWGTALAWFANVTGGWPDEDRNRLADLFYGPNGLGWTIARYNIGGGERVGAAADYMRPGAAVPGFWKQPSGTTGKDWWNPEDESMWDWGRDQNQRWWLDAVKSRVKNPIYEAFSNSPPWFMTVSGRVSGAVKATEDNLRAGEEALFASYLARVVDELQRRHGITFRTLSPVNEPNTSYWHAGNRQEGSHWSPSRQAAMIDAADLALKRRKLGTRISAPDETNSHLLLADWEAYPPSTRARIGQMNVHSYGTLHQTAVRDITKASGIRLWMSENDHPLEGEPENFTSMGSALAFATHVIDDLKHLEPAAWVFWQAVEDLSARPGQDGSNWGLVKADLGESPGGARHMISVTRKYWAMAQFSRYIRPGYRLVPVDDLDTAGALSADGRLLVMVHVNGGLHPRQLKMPSGWAAQMIVTDQTRSAACVAGSVAPPRSIVTVVLTRPGTRRAGCK